MEEDFNFKDTMEDRVYSIPKSFEHHIHYDDDISEPSEYRKDRRVLAEATVNDIVYLHINSVGGCLSTLVQLSDSIRDSKAYVIGCLEAEAFSAAGALLLQCDSFRVSPNAALMIHEAEFGVEGSGNKLTKHIMFQEKYQKKVFSYFYQDFLNEEEIQRVLSGDDIWMESEEIISRLDNLILSRENKLLT